MRITPLPLMYIVMFPVVLILLSAHSFFRVCKHKYKGRKKRYIFHHIAYFLPEKSFHEKLRIALNHFLNFIFFIIDMLKAIGISDNELKRRVTLSDYACAQLRQCVQDKQSFVLLGAHFGHWEWGVIRIGLEISPHHLYIAYKPLTNKLFNKLMFNTRRRYCYPIPTNDLSQIRRINKSELPTMAIMADQQPGTADKKCWGYLLGREKASPVGIHRIPGLLKGKVFFTYCKRERLGHYSVDMKQIAVAQHHITVQDILPAYLHELGELLKKYPEQYFWGIIKRNYTRQPDEEIIDFNS